MAAKLYVIPGSHPSLAGRRMLEHKGIDYKRIDLLPVISRGVLKALRFPAATVPALVLDGRRIQGTREISRALDELRPEPPLFPADPERRRAVEEAERWGDEVLQVIPRRVLWWAMKRDRSPLVSFSEGARIGLPIGLAVKTAGPIVWAAGRLNESDDDKVLADLRTLPAALDKVDAWIAEGVLGADPPNAADYQIATSVRLLMTLDDLRSRIEGRPVADLALRVAPEYPGRVPPVLPEEWLAQAFGAPAAAAAAAAPG